MLWLILGTALAGTPTVLPGTGSVLPTSDPGGGWLALMDQGGAHRLLPVNVRVDAAWGAVVIDPAVPAALLLRQVDGVSPGLVVTTAGPQDLAPGSALALVGGGTLSAHGAEVAWEADPDHCPYPYQVVLDAPGTRQTLFAGCSTLGEGSVQWAGDLDRDGRPDLALWMPTGPYGTALELWLSSAAGPGEAVGRVASWIEEPGC